MINARVKQQFELGLFHFEKALALNRNYANVLVNIGFTKRFMGRAAEGLRHFERALRLSPRDPQLGQWYRYYGASLLDLRRYDEAIEWLNRALVADPSVEFVYRSLISALAHSGRMAEARQHLTAFIAIRPGASLRAIARSWNPCSTPTRRTWWIICSMDCARRGYPSKFATSTR